MLSPDNNLDLVDAARALEALVSAIEASPRGFEFSSSADTADAHETLRVCRASLDKLEEQLHRATVERVQWLKNELDALLKVVS